MAFGLGRLRLAPSHFWAMTPRELAAAAGMGLAGAGERLSRAAFDGLVARFPDIQRK